MGRSVGGRDRKPPTGGRRRRVLARERGIVPSAIPPADQQVKCKACRISVRRGDTRFGYCTGCWSPPAP